MERGMSMKKHDDVFGEIEYDYCWEKTEELGVHGINREITVLVEADEDEEILGLQRDNYLQYQSKKGIWYAKLPKALLNYYLDNYEYISEWADIPEKIDDKNITELLIIKLVRITSVIFKRDGRFGWLCDCAWDEGHGICVMFSQDKLIVEIQDLLIQ